MQKHVIAVFSGLIFIAGCKDPAKENKDIGRNDREPVKMEATIFGNYVSEGYDKRNEGYDWVAVKVEELSKEKAKIKVRSRADKKRPTCTLDVIAQKIDDTTYRAFIDGKGVLFKIHDKILSIETELPEEENLLYFYCSGGASVAGTYQKINSSIDATQVDKTLFSKILQLQDVGFNVSCIEKNGTRILTVAPFGLETDNEPKDLEIYGKVTDAEIEDLNADGFPEVLVYIVSDGSGSYGDVIGYSVNNGKSMTRISFPELSGNKEAIIGYMGHDEFAIVENSLVRRFPVYKDRDPNSNPTGGTRQIQYKLKEGEASRLFVIDKIITY